MRKGLDKNSAQLFSGSGTTNRLSGGFHRSGQDKHPYMKATFWQNPNNQFWNSDMYSEKSKQYFNNWVTTLSNAKNPL